MALVKGPLCTRTSLVGDFRRLGVQSGETLLVHSSLKSMGWVCGGAETVIQALLEVLGPDGTLAVPTHSGDNSDPSQWKAPPVPEEWWSTIRETSPAYNPKTTRTRGMGVIAETLRTWPGAERSAHPQTSFAAIGPNASFITSSHSLECQMGEKSPLARLEDLDARVLLLGVGFDVCTAFHLAEYRTCTSFVDNSFAVMTKEGRRWVTVSELALSDEDFHQLGSEFENVSKMETGRVGAAQTRVFDITAAVAYAKTWFEKYRQ